MTAFSCDAHEPWKFAGCGLLTSDNSRRSYSTFASTARDICHCQTRISTLMLGSNWLPRRFRVAEPSTTIWYAKPPVSYRWQRDLRCLFLAFSLDSRFYLMFSNLHILYLSYYECATCIMHTRHSRSCDFNFIGRFSE